MEWAAKRQVDTFLVSSGAVTNELWYHVNFKRAETDLASEDSTSFLNPKNCSNNYDYCISQNVSLNERNETKRNETKRNEIKPNIIRNRRSQSCQLDTQPCVTGTSTRVHVYVLEYDTYIYPMASPVLCFVRMCLLPSVRVYSGTDRYHVRFRIMMLQYIYPGYLRIYFATRSRYRYCNTTYMACQRPDNTGAHMLQ